MSLTDRIAAWVEEANTDRLRTIGEVHFMRSELDRPKASAHLVLSSRSRLGEVTVWDSGEVELSQVAPDDALDEHHQVDDPAELDALLERLVRGFES